MHTAEEHAALKRKEDVDKEQGSSTLDDFFFSAVHCFSQALYTLQLAFIQTADISANLS